MEFDPLWASTLALFRGDEAAGGSSGTSFRNKAADEILTPRPLVIFGNPTISASQSAYGTLSYFFDGTGDCITAPSGSGVINYWPLFATSTSQSGTGDFCIDGWLYPTAVSTTAGTMFAVNSSNTGDGIWATLTPNTGKTAYDRLSIRVYSTSFGAMDIYFSVPGNLPLNTWSHISYNRVAGYISCYLNGVGLTALAPFPGTAIYTAATSNPVLSSTRMFVGGLSFSNNAAQPDYLFQGYMNGIRFTRAARQTANFTPPTVPTAPPGFGVYGVEGTVRNATNDPVGRTVRAYKRSDGLLVASAVSSTTTGDYALGFATADEVYILCLDDLDGSYEEDVIRRAIPAN